MTLLEDETLAGILSEKHQHKMITVCKCQALQILLFLYVMDNLAFLFWLIFSSFFSGAQLSDFERV